MTLNITLLTRKQWDTLAATVDRLIPADDFPAGWQGGVDDYLQRQLAGDLAERLALYKAGLDALDEEAQISLGVGFSQAAPKAQDEMLARVEKGDVVTPWSIRPAYFFNQVLSHALEGFYADPGNGGNKDQLSWNMIGFEVSA